MDAGPVSTSWLCSCLPAGGEDAGWSPQGFPSTSPGLPINIKCIEITLPIRQYLMDTRLQSVSWGLTGWFMSQLLVRRRLQTLLMLSRMKRCKRRCSEGCMQERGTGLAIDKFREMQFILQEAGRSTTNTPQHKSETSDRHPLPFINQGEFGNME